MANMVVFVEYWCFMLWFGRLAFNSSNIEYGFVVSIFLWRLRPSSGSRRSTSDSLQLNKIMSLSKMLLSISLSIWLSTTCEKLR